MRKAGARRDQRYRTPDVPAVVVSLVPCLDRMNRIDRIYASS